MDKRTVPAEVRRQFAVRSTRESARLERREVPADHVRSAKVEEYVASLAQRLQS